MILKKKFIRLEFFFYFIPFYFFLSLEFFTDFKNDLDFLESFYLLFFV
jgi:hypothetical protein